MKPQLGGGGGEGSMPLFGLNFSGYGLLNRVVFKALSLKRDIQFYYSLRALEHGFFLDQKPLKGGEVWQWPVDICGTNFFFPNNIFP